MTNWTLINLYAGCRGIEWAQTNRNHRALTLYHSNRIGNAYAFTRNDVQCFIENSLPLVLGFAIENPEMVGKIKLRFEEQKNGENGEWKLFTKNIVNPNLCFATHFMAILKRHAILTNSSPHMPLSVYKGTNGQPYNMTTVEVERVIRAAAATLFQLDPIGMSERKGRQADGFATRNKRSESQFATTSTTTTTTTIAIKLAFHRPTSPS
jgi:hypothetical protein